MSARLCIVVSALLCAAAQEELFAPLLPPHLTPSAAEQAVEAEAGMRARTRYARNSLLLPVPCREHLPAVFGTMGMLGRAAEVGVLRGEFSKHILETWKGQMLYMVDPWLHQSDSVYVDLNNAEQDVQDGHMATALRNVQAHAGRFQLLRDFSVNASRLLVDDDLDWVYLDADHSYSAVAEDLRAWWPKVRPGGVLAGHDFVLDGFYPRAGTFGVMRAVLEFAMEHGRQVVTTFSEPGGPLAEGSAYCGTRMPSWYLRR